ARRPLHRADAPVLRGGTGRAARLAAPGVAAADRVRDGARLSQPEVRAGERARARHRARVPVAAAEGPAVRGGTRAQRRVLAEALPAGARAARAAAWVGRARGA